MNVQYKLSINLRNAQNPNTAQAFATAIYFKANTENYFFFHNVFQGKIPRNFWKTLIIDLGLYIIVHK